jgi:hypothetical protein
MSPPDVDICVSVPYLIFYVAGTKIGKHNRAELLKEVQETDWREDLKHVEPTHDASDPRIERMRSFSLSLQSICWSSVSDPRS